MALVTQIIFSKVEDFFDKEDLTEKILKGNTEELIEVLENIVEKESVFGDYIYAYIFDNWTKLKTKYKEYDDVPEEEYYKIIKKAFEDNGMKGKGALDPKKKIGLHKKKAKLNESGTSVSREDVFLFAFGLNMDVEVVSLLLKKALLQTDFNAKNYREAIYYWCLGPGKELGNSLNPYENMLKWMNYYENEITEKTFAMSGNIVTDKTETVILKNKLYDIRTERELRNYLINLKKSELKNLKLKSAVSLYAELRKKLPRINSEIQKRVNLKDDIKEEEEFLNPGIQKSVGEIFELRKAAYENYMVQNDIHERCVLLKKSVLKKIFEDVEFSEKAVQGRESGAVEVKRIDILLLEFIIFSADLSGELQENNWEENSKELWNTRFVDFDDEVGLLFKRCNMCDLEDPLYVRNPFELFLVICLLHKNPFEYFMASWYEAIS